MKTPAASEKLVRSLAAKAWKASGKPGPLPDFFVFAVRGYFRDTMGKPGVNDRGIYDDALFVVGRELFKSFQANTDPSVYRKGIASIVPGVHMFKPGKHGISRPGGGYPAFRPATKGEALPVTRDGITNPNPGIATNIHRGGKNGTSSEGCITVPPSLWDLFHALVTRGLKDSGLKEFACILVEGPIN